jgi:hypothetical protein
MAREIFAAVLGLDEGIGVRPFEQFGEEAEHVAARIVATVDSTFVSLM